MFPTTRGLQWPLAAHDANKGVFEGFLGGAQIVDRTLDDEPAVVDDGDAIAQPLDDFEDV